MEDGSISLLNCIITTSVVATTSTILGTVLSLTISKLIF